MIDRLPELARFSEAGVKPGESLDLLLAQAKQPIVLFTSDKDRQAAHDYQAVLGKKPGQLDVVTVANPIQEASKLTASGVIPLVIHSATDPILFERMFADGPSLGQLLMGHVYRTEVDHQSPSVHVVGIANQGLKLISGLNIQSNGQVAEGMALRRREILGEGHISNGDFKRLLQSQRVRKIIAHALGPAGTNISQAMEQYIKVLGLEGKTQLIIHPQGVEPLGNETNPVGYVDLASQQIEEGVIPLHMECAVYYREEELFRTRPNEVILADHHYMPLDAMQLASADPIEALVNRGIMRITTHPSPRPLINPWVNSGMAEWLKATSNSAAAQMVLGGEADACITTASGLDKAPGLTSRHVFGRPWMFFTIATPLNQEQLKNYL